MYKADGVTGFYRGALPPFFGSCVYRSSQFAIAEMFYTRFEGNETMMTQIPGSGGIQLRTVAGGVSAGIFRAIVECPFEYSKVRGQTNQKWQFAEVYKGIGVVLLRNIGLLGSFICMLDVCRRKTNFMDAKVSQFFATGVMTSAAFWLIWPFEFLKNQIQAEKGNEFGRTYREKTRNIIRTHGLLGMYRGILPGTLSIFTRNGASMVVMQAAQKKLTQMGFRD